VRIALDSFGAGYASMNALRRLPVDILKLDRSFVEGVVESARLRKLTAGILAIAADLGLTTVADGVDVPEQALVLRSMGCTHGQGMVFSGPVDEHRLRASLRRGVFPVPRDPEAAAVSVPLAQRTPGASAPRVNAPFTY
jgi:EAL domain-containing protein (putative c-di-GMP-specific phosphodiesterase class I)